MTPAVLTLVLVAAVAYYLGTRVFYTRAGRFGYRSSLHI